MAVAREVWLRVVTIATKIPGEIDQIIASLYLKYFCNQMISSGYMVSTSFAVFAPNVLDTLEKKHLFFGLSKRYYYIKHLMQF